MPSIIARTALIVALPFFISSAAVAASVSSDPDLRAGLKSVVETYTEFMISKHQTELLCVKPADHATSEQYWDAARKGLVSEMLSHGFDTATAKRIDARMEQAGKADAGAQCPPDLKQGFAEGKWHPYDWGSDVTNTFEGVSTALAIKPERSQLKLRTLDQLDQIVAAAHKESDKRITTVRCIEATMPHSLPFIWSVEIGQNIRILSMMKAAGFPDEDLQQITADLDFKALMTFPTPEERAASVDGCRKNNDWWMDMTQFKFSPLEDEVRAILYDVPK